MSEKEYHWEPVYQGDAIINFKCPKCNMGNTFGKKWYGMLYCPRCGQRLLGYKEDKKQVESVYKR